VQLTKLAEAVPHDAVNVRFHRQLSIDDDAKMTNFLHQRHDALLADHEQRQIDLR